jgi:hypothetical protein
LLRVPSAQLSSLHLQWDGVFRAVPPDAQNCTRHTDENYTANDQPGGKAIQGKRFRAFRDTVFAGMLSCLGQPDPPEFHGFSRAPGSKGIANVLVSIILGISNSKYHF